MHSSNFKATVADLNLKVIEYLSKKGYSKTESMLRQESANQDVDGRPITTKAEQTGSTKYGRAFGKHQLSFIVFGRSAKLLSVRTDAILD